ncbi:DUF2269 family protein [Embleya scabrispora]|uniref:DUF2269 family protein n=1 Tax=Embleya scabrispora TaxID=159449 RepID=UPI0003A50EC4|nr:DUF2269 family protein [Embleya scabrispora]MYS83751.1 DUF2269 family protein [Streptomyces sp. SID5474]
MNASPTTGKRRYSRSVRRAVNSGHVVFAVGLLGVEWVMLLIAVVARWTDDPALRHGAYQLMRIFALAGGIPFAVLSLITGVLLCLRTPWGLWRHLWIKIKIVLLIAVIVAGAGVVSQFAHRMIAASASGGNADALPPLQTWHLIVVIFQLLALIVSTALSVFKPSGDRDRDRGRPRSGRRTDATPRARRASAVVVEDDPADAKRVPAGTGRPASLRSSRPLSREGSS